MAGTLTWDWNYSSPDFNGSGTLTTEDTTTTESGNTGYLATAITGTWNGKSIVTLIPPGNFYSDGLLGSSQPQLSDNGISFGTDFANGAYNIYFNGGNFSGGYGVTSINNYEGGTFTATLVEPALVISGITLAGTNVVLAATGGQSGGAYETLMSTNLSQWTPVATNVLSTGGNFSITITNAVNSSLPQAFYRLLQIQ
jgi:hypothetical protein